jgi:hypothetical protein
MLDVDTAVKLLYGHQAKAKVGYNPSKGRPSHAYPLKKLSLHPPHSSLGRDPSSPNCVRHFRLRIHPWSFAVSIVILIAIVAVIGVAVGCILFHLV